MRKSSVPVAAIGIVAAFALAACGSSGGGNNSSAPAQSTPAGGGNSSSAPASSSSSSSGGAINGNGAKVGIILPDKVSSPRWVTADPQALAAACKKYNLSCNIQNANGDISQMTSIANQMESTGIKVLMITNLSQPSGAAIEKKASASGITTVDYDRLTPGGGAALYVSFDGVKVGKAQGTALTQCPQVKGHKSVKYVEIDGAKTDNNALLFNQGYTSVLSKTPGWTKVDEQDGNWDASTAGQEFNSMLNNNHDIQAVMVANDTMAGGVITDLTRQGLNGKVAVSGQDATAPGLQQIMQGNQCFTIYKPSAQEAFPAMQAIAQLVNGQVPDTHGVTSDDPVLKTKVPSILATPVVITKANVARPINDGYTPKNTVCNKAPFTALCKQNGVK